MYANWISYVESLNSDTSLPTTVLDRFDQATSTGVVLSVVKSLNASQGAALRLDEPKDVEWTMEVVGFGLALPLEEDETLQACIDVYKDWLTPLYDASASASSRVPAPVRADPEPYARTIIRQYASVFKSRPGHVGVRHHVAICRRVLAIVHRLACEPMAASRLDRQTWEVLFDFVLGVSHRVLAPPVKAGGFAEHLADRLLGTLFDIYLRACDYYFPSPPYWRTLRDVCITWRHHHQVVDQWSDTVLRLTLRVIRLLYGPAYGAALRLVYVTEDEDARPSTSSMPDDAVVQCWFRMLHALGNLVDLSRKETIGGTPAFIEEAQRGSSLSLGDHVCLRQLPRIFFKAMKGLAANVDAFLTVGTTDEVVVPGDAATASPTSRHTPGLPTQTKTKSAASPGIAAAAAATVGLSRPDGNSLLHLFGHWLFEATIPSVPGLQDAAAAAAAAAGGDGGPSAAASAAGKGGVRRSSSDMTSFIVQDRRSSGSIEFIGKIDDVASSSTFEAGRAEAFGALCRIFCKQKCAAPFNQVYLARFYYAIAFGLQYDREKCTGQVLTSILINSRSLFRNDLMGVHVLLPHFIKALEIILPVKKHEFRFQLCTHELRESCVEILLSILCLPLHFKNVPIQDIACGVQANDESVDETFHSFSSKTSTFLSFHHRLAALLFSALKVEQDSRNRQSLLAGLHVLVRDTVETEHPDHIPTSLSPPTSPLTLADVATSASPPPTLGLNFEPARRLDQSMAARLSRSVGDDAASSLDNTTPRTRARLRGHVTKSGSWDGAELVVRTCREASQRFLQPRMEKHVTLSVLELLGDLANLNVPTVDPGEWSFTVKWLCDYISTLVGQESRYHSRDLHSTIVTAYQCLQEWILAQNRLLFEEETLRHVLEVVELGISGSKSEALTDGDSANVTIRQLKDQKARHPVSIRVMEAAEVLLTCIIEHLGSFPSPCGPASVSSQLNEDELLNLATARNKDAAAAVFRYFVLDSNTVFAILEHAVDEESDAFLPTVSLILRSPNGKRCWTVQLRHWPRNAGSQAEAHLIPVKRPEPKPDEQVKPLPVLPYWPKAADEVPIIKADYSIPPLDDILDAKGKEEQSRLHDAVLKAAETERIGAGKFEVEQRESSIPSRTEFVKPEVCTSFQTTRIFLSQLGILSLESLQAVPTQERPSLVTLGTSNPTLSTALRELDDIPTRSTETVYVLYVKAGQTTLSEMFQNKGTLRSPGHFHEFLLSLGWPVDLSTHLGWKGPFSSSRFKFCKLNPTPYYANVAMEMLFVVPSLQSQAPLLFDQTSSTVATPPPSLARSTTSQDGESFGRSLGVEQTRRSTASAPTSPIGDIGGGGPAGVTFPSRPQTLASTLETPPGRVGRKAAGRTVPSATISDLGLAIVWLERFEDHETFPLEKLSHAIQALNMCASESGTAAGGGGHALKPKADCAVVFVHPLKTGLYRILTACTSEKWVFAGPLLDGMVVSRRVLGLLARQTMINSSRRQQLEMDSFTTPHILRKRKIEEITSQHEQKLSIPAFMESLFNPAYKQP